MYLEYKYKKNFSNFQPLWGKKWEISLESGNWRGDLNLEIN